MTTGQAVGGLLLIYALIGGFATWKIRNICLLQRDDCGFRGLLETVLSERLVLIGSIVLLGLLVFMTLHVIVRARDGTLGVAQDPPRRKFDVNGLWVSLVVFALYLGGSAAFIASGAIDPSQINSGNASAFVWKTLAPMYGSALVFLILYHLNDYFSKPVPTIVLLLLFAATLGSVYLMLRPSI